MNWGSRQLDGEQPYRALTGGPAAVEIVHPGGAMTITWRIARRQERGCACWMGGPRDAGRAAACAGWWAGRDLDFRIGPSGADGTKTILLLATAGDGGWGVGDPAETARSRVDV